MAQQVLKSRTTFASTTNNLDNVSIDLVFEATGSSTNIDFTPAINPNSVIQAFFNSSLSSGRQISYYLAHELSRATGGASTSWTDITGKLNGVGLGSPFRTDNWTLGISESGSTLPLDASIVCSYRADYGTAPEKGAIESLPTPDDAIDYGAPPTHMGQVRPRARMRARFYLGPLNSTYALGTSAGLVAATALTDVTEAFQVMLRTQDPGAPNQFNLVIWSRRDAAVYTPTHWFLSEAFGTVRKRGDVSFPRVHAWQPVS